MCGVYKFRLISNTYFVHQHAYDDTRNNVFMGLLDNISNKSYFSKKWLSCFCVLWLWIKFSNDLVKLQEMLSSFWLENTINLYKLTWEKNGSVYITDPSALEHYLPVQSSMFYISFLSFVVIFIHTLHISC